MKRFRFLLQGLAVACVFLAVLIVGQVFSAYVETAPAFGEVAE